VTVLLARLHHRLTASPTSKDMSDVFRIASPASKDTHDPPAGELFCMAVWGYVIMLNCRKILILHAHSLD
jgi:hypothetical protein